MTASQYIQFAIDAWGVLFCALAIVCIFFTKQYDRRAAGRMSIIFLCCICMFSAGGAVCLLQSSTSETGHTLVTAGTFAGYIFEFAVMAAVVDYIAYRILSRTEIDLYMWKKIEYAITIIGVCVIIVNSIHPFVYSVDEFNRLVRMDFFLVPIFLILTGLVLAVGVILEYSVYLQPVERRATLSFLLLLMTGGVLEIIIPKINFIAIALTLSSMVLFISYLYNYSRYYIDMEKMRNEDRMKLISAQIHPHFIFNSLALIRHLSVHEPNETPRAINEFSAFLRAVTDLIDEDTPIPAVKEFDLVKHYVYMQQQRFGDDLHVEYDIEDDDFVVPAFAVQTTVENAITHGIRGKEEMEDSLIAVRSYLENGAEKWHVIEVTDNGTGFDPEESEKENTGSHSGIQATRERLMMMCGATYSIESVIGTGTKVTIRIPYQENEAASVSQI